MIIRYMHDYKDKKDGFSFEEAVCLDRRFHRTSQTANLSAGLVFDAQGASFYESASFIDGDRMDDVTSLWDLGDRFRHPIELHGIKA
jgi:hypothetical protein